MGLPHGVSPKTFFYVHNYFLVHIKLSSDKYKFLSVHNTDTFYTQVQTNFDRLFSLHLCIRKPTFFMYIHIFFVHIKYFSCKIKFFYLYITQILSTQTQINFDRSFPSRLYIQLNTIGTKRSIIPGETAFKPMGHPHGVSPNPPMYIHPSLYINSSFVYIFTSLYTIQTCK